jgi:hypothetical protein
MMNLQFPDEHTPEDTQVMREYARRLFQSDETTNPFTSASDTTEANASEVEPPSAPVISAQANMPTTMSPDPVQDFVHALFNPNNPDY